MEQEKERHQKSLAQQSAAYEAKMKDNNATDVIRAKMKDIEPDIKDANRIAKIMKKDIRFSKLYVSKIDDCDKF